jgi:hypothetical protein
LCTPADAAIGNDRQTDAANIYPFAAALRKEGLGRQEAFPIAYILSQLPPTRQETADIKRITPFVFRGLYFPLYYYYD